MNKQTLTSVYGVTPERLVEMFFSSFKAEVDKITEQLKSDLKQDVIKPERKFLTRKEAAEFLSVSTVTLNNWAKKGIVKRHRIGNLVRYDISELEQALI